VIQGLSLAGDVFWIIALALMASFTLAAWRRLGPGLAVPVLWKGMTPTLRAPRAVALLTLPTTAFLVGAWLKFESGSAALDLAGAIITLGVRVSLAPLVALLQIGRVQKALAILEAEGALPPPR